ncbi:patatin-like phospholipase family protein [Spirillospora sp. NPDC127200]
MHDQLPVAFVLGSGGYQAHVEIGMLAALVEAGVRPDIVVGASAGGWTGAVFATSPDHRGLTAVRNLWCEMLTSPRIGGSLSRLVLGLASPAVQADRQAAMRAAFGHHLTVADFDRLPVRFSCSGLEVGTGVNRWFGDGPLVPAMLAAAALPGVVAPARIDGRLYIDGGLLDPLPLTQAAALGARTIYALPVTDLRPPLRPAALLREVVPVAALMLARFGVACAALPDDVTVRLLPVGDPDGATGARLGLTLGGLVHGDPLTRAQRGIDLAYQATARYLHDLRSDCPGRSAMPVPPGHQATFEEPR